MGKKRWSDCDGCWVEFLVFFATFKHGKCWKKNATDSFSSVGRTVVSWMWWYLHFLLARIYLQLLMSWWVLAGVLPYILHYFAALQTTTSLYSALVNHLSLSPLVDFWWFLYISGPASYGSGAPECISSWCPSHLWYSINCMVCWWNDQSPCHIPSSIT